MGRRNTVSACACAGEEACTAASLLPAAAAAAACACTGSAVSAHAQDQLDKGVTVMVELHRALPDSAEVTIVRAAVM